MFYDRRVKLAVIDPDDREITLKKPRLFIICALLFAILDMRNALFPPIHAMKIYRAY